MNRESLEFGRGSFVGAVMRDQDFFDQPVEEQARILAWADSCPVVEELIDPNNQDPGRGPENMLNRYGQVNFWFGYIGREAQEHNPPLYDKLMSPVPRKLDEPVGKVEKQSVPDSYFEEMPPMSTLAGYSMPRLFIEQTGLNKDLDKDEVQSRLTRGQNALESAVALAKSPNELLALTARNITERGDVEPKKVLSLIMSRGWLDEHNAHTMLEDFKDSLCLMAPGLWRVYESLSEEEKAELKLA